MLLHYERGEPITRRALFLGRGSILWPCTQFFLLLHYEKGGPITRRALLLVKNNTKCMSLSLRVHFARGAQGKSTIERISADLAKCCSRLGAAYDSGTHVAALNFSCFYIMKGGADNSAGIFPCKKQYKMHFVFASCAFCSGSSRKKGGTDNSAGILPFKNNSKCIFVFASCAFCLGSSRKKGGAITRRAVFLVKNNTQSISLSPRCSFRGKLYKKATSSSISPDLVKSCSRLGAAYDCGINVAEAPCLFNTYYSKSVAGQLFVKAMQDAFRSRLVVCHSGS